MLIGGNVMSTQAVGNDDKKEETKLAHKLDAQAYNGNDLGATYSKGATVFKVWAPTARRVAVKLYATGSPDEEGATDISTTSMTKGDNGVWTAKVSGDHKNQYYTYLVTNNGITTETQDVYSKAVGVNGNRSMVVDLPSTNPEGWKNDKHILVDDPTDAVVWEIHMRDFSVSQVSGVSPEHKGKYLAFTEKGTTLAGQENIPTCVDYLKKLGVTHVQLMPVYDYATVDESITGSDEYNWGYDPKNYNVPEGSYSTNPFDGNVRIREFKQMIKALHDAGIGVIMDVVYNHTFTAKGSCFENTVPGYYFRLKDDGSLSDGSGCGNETASDHLMYRKYMIDSILYWTNEYHIDGFRFDLMGVHDTETMNQIRNALDTKVEGGKKIIMYGEPWTGGATSCSTKTAVKENIKELDTRIGAFNDSFRDAVKGHVFNAQEAGFVQTGKGAAALRESITANSVEGNKWLSQPSQSVTYISAHDNFTLYDKLIMSTKNDGSFDTRDESLVKMNKLAAAITLTSQGIVFMQAGEEFARTKFGDENSYISPDNINMLDWNNVVKYGDLSSYYQGLIEIRKNFKPFRDPTKTSAEKITFAEADDGVVAYTLENSLTKGKEWSYAAVLFNASDSEKSVTLKQSGNTQLPEKWEIIADRTQAGLKGLGEVEGNTVTIPAKSAMVMVDKESFDSLKITSDTCTVNIEYVDSDSGEVLESHVLKGKEGEGFLANDGKDYSIDYDFVGIEGAAENGKGKFTAKEQTVTYKYKKYGGNIYNITVKYLRQGDKDFGTGDSEMAPAVVKRVRQDDIYTADIKKIDGMIVDMSKFPGNASGVAYGDTEVCYYYIQEPACDLVVHYYNSQAWKKVFGYVYTESEDGTEELCGKNPGQEMKKDSSLGDGWFTLTVKDAGTTEGVKAVFSDGTDKNKDAVIYNVNRQTWIQDGKVTGMGNVYVIYADNMGEVLNTETISGKIGTTYTTEEKGFDEHTFIGATENAAGEISASPSYVFYSYKKLVPEPDIDDNSGMVKLVIIVLGASLVTFAIAAVIGGIYAKRKKRWELDK